MQGDSGAVLSGALSDVNFGHVGDIFVTLIENS